MTDFCKRKVGNKIVEYPLSKWEEMKLEWESSKYDSDTEIKKVPIIRPLKTGREKHDFGKRS